MNLNLCTNLEIIRSLQLLFSSFATQNSIQTTKSLSLWEVIQLAGALLTHPETATSAQLSPLCIHPTSSTAACKCINNTLFYRLHGRIEATHQDDKWLDFGSPRIQGQ